MSSPKEIARLADKKEKERIEGLIKEFSQEHKRITNADIFDSEEIPKLFKNSPLSFNSSVDDALPSLPLNSLIFTKNIVMICPSALKKALG
jgi:hypothetical protein